MISRQGVVYALYDAFPGLLQYVRSFKLPGFILAGNRHGLIWRPIGRQLV